jgi:hypothetical protein
MADFTKKINEIEIKAWKKSNGKYYASLNYTGNIFSIDMKVINHEVNTSDKTYTKKQLEKYAYELSDMAE